MEYGTDHRARIVTALALLAAFSVLPPAASVVRAEVTLHAPALVTEPVVLDFGFSFTVPAGMIVEDVRVFLDDSSLPDPSPSASEDTQIVLIGTITSPATELAPTHPIVPDTSSAADNATLYGFEFPLPLWQPGSNRVHVRVRTTDGGTAHDETSIPQSIVYELPSQNFGIGSAGPGGRFGTSFELPGIPIHAADCTFVVCKDADQDTLLDLWENVAVHVLAPVIHLDENEPLLDAVHDDQRGRVRTLTRVNKVLDAAGGFELDREIGINGVAFGDVDGDERDELAIALSADAGVRWMIIDDQVGGFAVLARGGDGTDGFGGAWGHGRRASAIAMGDVDGDGRAELAVGRTKGGGSRWQIFDDALTNFAPLREGSFGGEDRGVTALAFGDVDGDSRDELAIGRNGCCGGPGEGTAGVRWVILNDALGDQPSEVPPGEPTIPKFGIVASGGNEWGDDDRGVTALAFGDVDGDNKAELAVGRDGTGFFEADAGVRWQIFDDREQEFVQIASGGNGSDGAGDWGDDRKVTALAFGDIDGDGLEELAVARDGVGILQGDANARWQVFDDRFGITRLVPDERFGEIDANGFAQMAEGGGGWGFDRDATAIALGDVDGDGLAELAVGRDDGNHDRWQLFRWAGDPLSFVAIGQGGSQWGEERATTALAFGDVDGADASEFVIARNAGPFMRWQLHDNAPQVQQTLGRNLNQIAFRSTIALPRDYGTDIPVLCEPLDLDFILDWLTLGQAGLDEACEQAAPHNGDSEHVIALWDFVGNQLRLNAVSGEGHSEKEGWIVRFPGGRMNWVAKPDEITFAAQGSIELFVEEGKHGVWPSYDSCNGNSPYDCTSSDCAEENPCRTLLMQPVAANVGEPEREWNEIMPKGGVSCPESIPEGLEPRVGRPLVDRFDDVAASASHAVLAAAFPREAVFSCVEFAGKRKFCGGEVATDGEFDGCASPLARWINDRIDDLPRFRSSTTTPADRDRDGLLDRDEDKNGNGTVDPGETDPDDPDSDDDGTTDGDEVNVQGTDPLSADSDADGQSDGIDNCPRHANSDQGDLDGDGAGDVCDPDDAVLDLRRSRVRRATSGRANGEVIVTGDVVVAATDTFDAMNGIAVEIRDGNGRQIHFAWTADECSALASGRVVCQSDMGAFRQTSLPLTAQPGRIRFRLHFKNQPIGGPFASPLQVHVADGPPVFGEGIDRIGVLEACRTMSNGMLCRR